MARRLKLIRLLGFIEKQVRVGHPLSTQRQIQVIQVLMDRGSGESTMVERVPIT